MSQINKIQNLADSISENHQSRSRYMWELLANSERKNQGKSYELSIPRTIIQFWDNLTEVPKDVDKCMESWQRLESFGFSRLVFDDLSAKEYIKGNFDTKYSEAFSCCIHPAMRADYFRLCYLYKNGGFYVDADDVYTGISIEEFYKDNNLKVQPLCYDLSMNSMVDISGLSTVGKHSHDYIYYVNNDPIITPPNHPIIKLALERSTNFILRKTIGLKDIQSITGPGNLTASIIKHSIQMENQYRNSNVTFIRNWSDISYPKWPLEYRNDNRNWRIWDGSVM